MNEIGWCLIPPYVMAREDLTITQKMLYGRVLGLTKEKGYCFASNAWLGKQIGISKQTVANNLSEMQKKALLKLEPIRDEKQKVIRRKIFVSEASSTNAVIPLTADGNTPLTADGKYSISIKSNSISNNQQADDNKDFSSLKRLIGKEFPRRGASYDWQDYAVRMWKNLGLADNPSPSWFKLFKKTFSLNKRGLLDSTFATISDVGAKDPERYFYKVFNQKLSLYGG